ncbi:histidine--tRNA ligase [Mycoplasmopsis alligatoris]|uniref:Histidine--tRNA ligase n=1 Tax=Mycoplasmopsis alligatoris A21JP2 TaxID=747682 RepID=D4XV88_9BACT|nr:histidine--tRNA ligase [Mycoplasmopsis alligatoris]EFF41722.1 histidine--tRNA ligase [Mycoplasmopsis alligatoris A21JP2]
MYKKVKGTIDYNPIHWYLKNMVTSQFKELSMSNDFSMVETPILEHSELFRKSVENSDIVNKEMYEFFDKAQRSLTLRPEGTAPFVRAYIENRWDTLDNQKFAYYGPMFRYEQPQSGRYRQFYQAGMEIVGTKNYLKDVEIIKLGSKLLDDLNIEYNLIINSIGDAQSRNEYEKALKKYLLPFKDQLSEISQKRLEGNVLRILDDKIASKKDFMKNAPKISKFISEESKAYFNEITYLLDDFQIKYQINNKLVRGLDYYDEVVFEFVSKNPMSGSQSTLIGGGRYSNLFALLGGKNVSSVGMGIGIDRIVFLIRELIEKDYEQDKKNPDFKHKSLESYVLDDLNNIDIYIASSTDTDNLSELFTINDAFISSNLKTKFEYDIIKVKKIFERANKYNAAFIMFDDGSKDDGLYVLKNMKTGEKINVSPEGTELRTIFQFIADSDENGNYDYLLDEINNEDYGD